MKERIAIIDLGTNTFHLLIAEWEGNQLKIVYREKVAVKLGLAGINQGMITEEAIQRGLQCLRNFDALLKKWNVGKVTGLGTSALRSARNGQEVIQRFHRETGLNLIIISGDEEAKYIYYGVRSAMDLGLEKSLIVDIGGGSVEYIIGDRDQINWKQSFEMGAQRLLELYQQHDPMLEEEIKKLETHFTNTLRPLAAAIIQWAPTILVGSSGTFDTLSEIYCLRNSIHTEANQAETPLTIASFRSVYKELISKNRADRMLIPGMIEMRVDMIVVASCLVNYLINTFSFERIRVSSYSLKEGMLTQWGKSEPGR